MTPSETKLVNLASKKGANDADVLLLDEIQSLEARVDKIEEINTQEINDLDKKIAAVKDKIPYFDIFKKKIQKILDSIRGKDGADGIRGKKGERGEKGDTGEAGADGIGINGKDGKDGADGKDAIHDLTEIEKLREDIEKLKTSITKIPRGRIGGSRKVPMISITDLTSQVNGIVTTYTLPRDTVRVHMVWSTQFPVILRPTTDFTFAGQTLTLTSAVGVIQSGQTLTALIETLFYQF